jgi:hypothetical protein
MDALTLTEGAMEEVDHSEVRRERTFPRAPGIPRQRPPASVKPTPEPREGDAYDDVLLDYESDTYEYLQKHGAGACKPVRFVYAGQFSAPSDEEVEREWELAMAESRRWASAKGPPLQINTSPRFAGLGSVKEFQPYREATSGDE